MSIGDRIIEQMKRTTKTVDEIKNLRLLDYINEANIDMGGTASGTGKVIGSDTATAEKGSSKQKDLGNEPSTAEKLASFNSQKSQQQSVTYDKGRKQYSTKDKNGRTIWLSHEDSRNIRSGKSPGTYEVKVSDGKHETMDDKKLSKYIVDKDKEGIDGKSSIGKKVKKMKAGVDRFVRDNVTDPFMSGKRAVMGESSDGDLDRVLELAGIVSETTTSGSIASGPSIVGNTSKSHLPTDKLRVKNKKKKKNDRIEKDRKERKKRREEKEKLRKR